MATFVEVIAPHADFMSKGSRCCTCGTWEDATPAAASTRVPFTTHLHQVLTDAGMAVISLDGLLRICTTVVEEKATKR